MAITPVEIVTIGDVPVFDIEQVIKIANSIQSEFTYMPLSEEMAKDFKKLSYQFTTVQKFFDSVEEIKKQVRGYHPFIISIVDSRLEGKKYSNLFGSIRAEVGIALFTIADVEEVIIPKGKMDAYYLYYFARYTLSFLAPNQKNHEETKGCVFDRKVNKLDILKSMKRRAICDDCRNDLVNTENLLTTAQFEALDALFELAGDIYKGKSKPTQKIVKLNRDQVYRHIYSLCQNDSLFAIADYGESIQSGDYERIVISDAKSLRNGVRNAIIGSIRLLPYGTGTLAVFINKDVLWNSEISESGGRLFQFFIERVNKHFDELDNMENTRQMESNPQKRKTDSRNNREMYFKLACSVIILGIALLGFKYLTLFTAVLWLLFLIIAYPVALAFTVAKQSFDNRNLVEIYKAGLTQVPIIGKFLPKSEK
ncbi:MAG: hypothetical protein GX428_08205 [Candidatus Atribacteria bacterium]|nr:hypothetical protein [Candidatus Atribacteria bacterium]